MCVSRCHVDQPNLLFRYCNKRVPSNPPNSMQGVRVWETMVRLV